MNNREEDNFVMERLDKAFASVEWIEAYPNYALRNHPIIRSDHGPIILDFDLKLPFRRRPFRFECMRTTHPSCKEVVQKAWSNSTSSSRAYQLMHKVASVRKEFIQWNKDVFGIIEQEIKQKMRLLLDLQNNITSVADVGEERVHREDLESLLQREELMWAQKARSEWILKGDRNTRFFQTVVKQRRAKSRIHCIKNAKGVLIEDPEGVEKIFVGHFNSAYEASNTSTVANIMEQLHTLPIPQFTGQQCYQLNRPVTLNEIENTVFQLGHFKAPGPSGIPAFFYQGFWQTVKYDICSTVQAFFHSGSLLETLNQTYLTLIPKVNFPEYVSHFRPISLCNVVFKIISKIMVNRLKPFIDTLITPLPFKMHSLKGGT